MFVHVVVFALLARVSVVIFGFTLLLVIASVALFVYLMSLVNPRVWA
jgi:hypothetical protein